MRRIWILEDDPGSQFVYQELLGHIYTIRIFDALPPFIQALSEPEAPNLLIVDLLMNGTSLLSYWDSFADVQLPPFFVISCLENPETLRKCFEVGAADFLTKPFSSVELLVKLERFFDPAPSAAEMSCEWSGYWLNPGNLRIISPNGDFAQLTLREYQILSTIMAKPNREDDRSSLMKAVWGSLNVNSKNLDVQISNLRKKMRPLDLTIECYRPDCFQLVCKKMPRERIKEKFNRLSE